MYFWWLQSWLPMHAAVRYLAARGAGCGIRSVCTEAVTMQGPRSSQVVAVCLLALLALVALPCTHASDGNFDYYYLVRQWPATFCNDHACTHKPPRSFTFTLHGLWPQRKDGTWPEFCDPSDHLQVRQIWDLIPFLAHYWPSWSSDNKAFWEHEWSRHGTCADLGGQHAFFGGVLRLHRTLNIQAALEAAGIAPSTSRRYPVADVEEAIRKQHGVVPRITCDYSSNLAEVWMCIGKDLKPMDCTQATHSNTNTNATRSSSTPGQRSSSRSSRRVARGRVGGSRRNNVCTMVRIPPLGSSSSNAQQQQAAAARSQVAAARGAPLQPQLLLKGLRQRLASWAAHAW